ncbi:sodium channel regulatory subunit beta-3-like isoform X2 [Channa argus]|uniref:sodium channel regulatory subunit beta-3-like isoform X2 n=1 Tax=Channa argus TaxID=215402 RepID=UPI003520BEBA
MSDLIYLLLFILYMYIIVQKEIEVKPGEDATLQCQCPRHADITLLEWSRPELKKDGYVFFYRNSRPYENYQHQFFMGRVELRNESSVKDGDVSVILKNVNISDTGTYECRIVISNPGSSGRTTTELKHLITLKVSESGGGAEHVLDGVIKNQPTDSGGGAEHILKERMKDGGNKNQYHAFVLSVSVITVCWYLCCEI